MVDKKGLRFEARVRGNARSSLTRPHLGDDNYGYDGTYEKESQPAGHAHAIDPFDTFFDAASAPMQKMAPTLMRTDIKETDEGYEMTIDLPGFKKDETCRPS